MVSGSELPSRFLLSASQVCLSGPTLGSVAGYMSECLEVSKGRENFRDNADGRWLASSAICDLRAAPDSAKQAPIHSAGQGNRPGSSVHCNFQQTYIGPALSTASGPVSQFVHPPAATRSNVST
ncbi:hypothetical protein N656DRAFT_774752 [Canariomyces notabilis]|uniref:Uncharacterized protein n=1 Tax=Canariomyces notabilis TaxID=2074819 RepID=A0AAN6TL42_9PEZI|nr:hypothetical protein N656DRAFT_774752 [Canariomyces arenarius]